MHEISYRIYYEDTDSGGVVYHANYLKFAERARTDFLRSIGITQSTLAKEQGILFVVRHIEMDLLKGAKLDDMLNIKTNIDKMSGASMVMNQTISAYENLLCKITVKVACVNSDIAPVRIPKEIKERFSVQG
ncbi:MAG: tol-pal system-associated acyl-CoA thioesterase [Rickettsiales bacterium]|nr:tol-pal system-associated acyl-CoA thioesterase [Pseudomonadota bacterium]MDA0965645.1 tol-pal system-associated acyl-CoA thioesterase [Pseudomonadota bacterium]MDG4542969.1 tol-pal system-associated acyl-CoA thioesterase [Rickettsiales bacterium]MDG4544583.1 tol-pal system-associated acyl-CoA thioesterase [Rickettsiales bacterium]MDG4546705.1 tol-pal system-associated acyl-CoA thioesterase [Rickettsiales bacterium]